MTIYNRLRRGEVADVAALIGEHEITADEARAVLLNLLERIGQLERKVGTHYHPSEAELAQIRKDNPHGDC
jgi:hypothetical protein